MAEIEIHELTEQEWEAGKAATLALAELDPTVDVRPLIAN